MGSRFTRRRFLKGLGACAGYLALTNTMGLIGWSSGPFISEFSHEGKLLFEAQFPPDGESYRAFRFPWIGYPDDDPIVALEQGPDDKVQLYASWNGAP
ncbi:MAG TPA: twin-arginine translocation signal domain-containing protein [Rubrobacter sp.]|nr:twin-arginine translocation signal domain-containing protein [Rubrobacter sp.]